MKIRKLLLAALMAVAATGIIPIHAQATECVQDVPNTTVDDKVVGHTCWDCGWIMVRGQAYTLVYCD